MSKIVTAVNAMVSNPEKITNVIKGQHETECFFKYDKKHNWSILKNKEGQYYLSYFPGNPILEELASIPDEYWSEHAPLAVNYNSKELGTKEAYDSLAELFTIVSEKAYGMDEVLSDIINSAMPF